MATNSDITQETIEQLLTLRNHAQRTPLVYDEEKLTDQKRLNLFIKSLETCTNIAPYQGLDSYSRLFGTIDFEHLYTKLSTIHDSEESKKELKDDDEDKFAQHIAQQTNEIFSQVKDEVLKNNQHLIKLISSGQKLFDQTLASHENSHQKNLMAFATAQVANTLKIHYTPAEKITSMIAQTFLNHLTLYSSTYAYFESQLENLKQENQRSTKALEDKQMTITQQAKQKDLAQEIHKLQNKFTQQTTEILIKIRVCAITMHALFICLEKPEEAQEIAKQTEKALNYVDEDMANEAKDFIKRAIAKLRQEALYTIQAALAFNLGHLKALMLQSTALVSDEKNAREIIARNSTFDCKEGSEYLEHLHKNYASAPSNHLQALEALSSAKEHEKNCREKLENASKLYEASREQEEKEEENNIADAYEQYTLATFNHFQASKDLKLAEINEEALKAKLEFSTKLYQTAQKAEDYKTIAHQNAQNFLQELAQDEQSPLTRMHQQAQEYVKTIETIFEKYAQQLSFTPDVQQNMLKQAHGYLAIIKNNERLGIPILPIFAIPVDHKQAQQVRKRHDRDDKAAQQQLNQQQQTKGNKRKNKSSLCYFLENCIRRCKNRFSS